MPGVSVGFAFDVATFGVVNLARRLLCACGDFACDFEHFLGDCSSFGDEFKGYVRYSVKDRERNCRFIAAVDSVING